MTWPGTAGWARGLFDRDGDFVFELDAVAESVVDVESGTW